VDAPELTQQGTILGTPLYMSPEQASGAAVDARADLFSLGSVLYTLCTGRPAFEAETTMAVLLRVRHDTPPPIHASRPDLPEWLEAIVFRLLAKDPAERFQSAREVAELLEKGRAAASMVSPRPRRRLRRWVAVFGILGLLLAVGLLVWFQSGGGK
jgi:serine/threonine protein kinase